MPQVNEPVDLAVADRPDLARAEFGGDPFAVPVRQQPDRDDHPLDRCRELAAAGRAIVVDQPDKPLGSEPLAPAEQARPAAGVPPADLGHGGTLAPGPQRGPTPTDDRGAPVRILPHRRAAILGREKEEPRPCLEVIAAREPVRV